MAKQVRIRRGDTVEVINGTDKGARGEVIRVIPKHGRLVVQGVAMRKKHQRQVQAGNLPIQDLYHLSRAAAMGKMIAVSFYFGEINLAGFRRKFGISLEQAFPAEVEFLLREELMAYYGDEKDGNGRKVMKDGQTTMDNGPMTMGGQRGTNGRGASAQTLRLTEWGEQNVNGVTAQFYAGAVKNHLLEMANTGERVSILAQIPAAILSP